MTAIDRKPPDPPSLIAIAATLAREGRGPEAIAVRQAAEWTAELAKMLGCEDSQHCVVSALSLLVSECDWQRKTICELRQRKIDEDKH